MAVDVSCSHDSITVVLDDGRRVTAPLDWFPRLVVATPRQRRHWEPIGAGIGIHCEEIDEDISVASLLQPEKFMPLMNSKARESVWRSCNAWCCATEEESGRREKSMKGLLSIFRFPGRDR